MRGCTALVAVLAACGNVQEKTDAMPGSDSSSNDSQMIDGPLVDSPPARCDRAKPWGTPVLVPGLAGSYDDADAWVSEDELTLYFSTDRAGGNNGYEIYTSTRPSTAAAWGMPAAVANVSSGQPDRRPTLSPDGLALYQSRQTVGTADWNILVSTRASTSAPFGAPANEPSLNGAVSDSGLYILGDRSAVFTSGRSGNDELYTAQWTGTAYGQITMIEGVQDAAPDEGPMMTSDKLELYWASARVNQQLDIYRATRSSTTENFGNVASVTELSSTLDDIPSWIAPDGCVMYFTRRTTIGATPAYYQLFVTVRPL